MAEHQQAVYRVRESFSFDHAGRSYVMRIGDIVDALHPAFKGRAALFEEVTSENGQREYTAGASGLIETATANPGEKRSVRSPKANA